MYKSIIYALFTFLKSEGALVAFMVNLFTQKNDRSYFKWPQTIQNLQKINPHNLINEAFQWNKTPEEHRFWEKLDEKWRLDLKYFLKTVMSTTKIPQPSTGYRTKHKEFVDWMREKGELVNFMHNVRLGGWKMDMDHLFQDVSNFWLIAQAFSWDETTEGYEHWMHLDSRWHEHAKREKELKLGKIAAEIAS